MLISNENELERGRKLYELQASCTECIARNEELGNSFNPRDCMYCATGRALKRLDSQSSTKSNWYQF